MIQDTRPPLNLSVMARILGVKPRWLREEASSGRVPAVAAGDTFLFDPDAVERVLLERARQGTKVGNASCRDAD